MRSSFTEWITRPRQILILFAITLAVAAISASNNIHRCHARKVGQGKQRYQMRDHHVGNGVESGGSRHWDESVVKQLAQGAKAFAFGNQASLTGKEATLVNQISDKLVETVAEEDIEADMAEELGMQEEDAAGEVNEELADASGRPGGASSSSKSGGSRPRGSRDHRFSKPSESSGFCPAIHRREDGTCDRSGVPESLQKYFKGSFGGDLILTSTSLRNKSVIAVSSSPGKTRKSKLMDVNSHLLDLLPKEDQIFGKNFTTCAVIGSSGILLKYQNGKEIDGHDMVLRFNSARTKGFEKHVGGKTTHRLTNSRNFGFRESKSEQVLVHLRTPGAMRALVQRLKNKTKSVLYGLNPPWYSYMDKSLHFLSTSGLNGILIALHRCERVRLYGFHVHPRHGVPYHYYNVKDKPANVGRDDNEWLVVKHLIENKFVELGEPCILECNENESECQKCVKANQ
ncbi:sialyltransferase [Chloropicon primus]|uniref:Sialyltransferase n=1 Tax=Chloropicon primus TaxID=1764295 RepID=A0A5B8MEL0_9CHLO|nr:sialyltransferase [Chloropicon primus]UPQ98267.1 sialyltransferase [Chloropicon primus]|eukprot:QDZ19058.1 sialyltransferase [Chloropicon primus]